MRQITFQKLSARLRATSAAVAAIVICLITFAALPASRMQAQAAPTEPNVDVWDETSTSGTWYYSATNWIASGTPHATFSMSNAVVFGASGTNNNVNYVWITTGSTSVSGTGILVNGQPYTGPGATSNGINPGVIIASGTWVYDCFTTYLTGTNSPDGATFFPTGSYYGGQPFTIYGGSIAVTGNSAMVFAESGTHYKQTITVANGVDFTLSATSMNGAVIGGGTFFSGNVVRVFTNGNDKTVTTAMITTGSSSNLTIANTSTMAAEFDFVNNSVVYDNATVKAAALQVGGDLTVTGSGLTVNFQSNHSGTSNAWTSAANIGGVFNLANSATLKGEGGFAAQQFNFANSTIIAYNSANSWQGGIITLSTVDASGNQVAALGKIIFNNMTITGSAGGGLAVTPGSDITIGGTLTLAISGTLQSSPDNILYISAPLVGSGGVTKTGNATVLFSGTNTYSGSTYVQSGTLIGSIPNNGDLTIDGSAAYLSGYGTANPAANRKFNTLNGSGFIDMGGKNLDINQGDFSNGTLNNVDTLNKNSAGVLSLSSGSANTLNINAGKLILGYDQQMVVAGVTTIASSATLGIAISDTAAIKTHDFQANGAHIDITNFGLLTMSASGTQANTLVISDNAINHSSYILTLDGASLSAPPSTNQFLAFGEDTTSAASGTSIRVNTSLVWNNTAASSAHGTFYINSGTFVLNAPLLDNTATTAYLSGWDGKTLTKTGGGTLVLNAANNTYSGNTYVNNGAVVNNGTLSSPNIIIDVSATWVNNGDMASSAAGAISNRGNFIFNSGTFGRIDNTGTITFNINNSGTIPGIYTHNGIVSGTGDIVKTGTGTLILAGANTNTGNVIIYSGTYSSSTAHNLDSAASYTIANIIGGYDSTGTVANTGSATLDLGGRDQNLKAVTFQDNLYSAYYYYNYGPGILSFGPAITNPVGATYANVTIGTLTSGTTGGILFMRTDYGAKRGDHLSITTAASGTYSVIISNTDSVKPDRSNALNMISLVGTATNSIATGTNAPTLVFTGTVESGIGLLTLHQGDGGAIFPDENSWYLGATNKYSNTADAIFATASVMGLEWLYSLDTVRGRMGDLRQETLMAPPPHKSSPLAYTNVASKGGNAWIRFSGYHLDATEKITGDKFNENVGSATIGIDKTYRWEENQYLLGALADIGAVNRRFDDITVGEPGSPNSTRTSRGDGQTSSYGLGFYFAYLNDNGWYGDTILKINGNSNSFTANSIDGTTNSADFNNAAWGISIEFGRFKKIKKTNWWWEPSAQIAFARINGANYNTSNNIDVNMTASTIQQYRLALRVGYDKSSSPIKPYLRVAVADIQGGATTVRVNDYDYSPGYNGVRTEAGGGITWAIDERSQIYLEYEYAHANKYSRPWALNFGYRHTW